MKVYAAGSVPVASLEPKKLDPPTPKFPPVATCQPSPGEAAGGVAFVLCTTIPTMTSPATTPAGRGTLIVPEVPVLCETDRSWAPEAVHDRDAVKAPGASSTSAARLEAGLVDTAVKAAPAVPAVSAARLARASAHSAAARRGVPTTHRSAGEAPD